MSEPTLGTNKHHSADRTRYILMMLTPEWTVTSCTPKTIMVFYTICYFWPNWWCSVSVGNLCLPTITTSLSGFLSSATLVWSCQSVSKKVLTPGPASCPMQCWPFSIISVGGLVALKTVGHSLPLGNFLPLIQDIHLIFDCSFLFSFSDSLFTLNICVPRDSKMVFLSSFSSLPSFPSTRSLDPLILCIKLQPEAHICRLEWFLNSGLLFH